MIIAIYIFSVSYSEHYYKVYWNFWLTQLPVEPIWSGCCITRKEFFEGGRGVYITSKIWNQILIHPSQIFTSKMQHRPTYSCLKSSFSHYSYCILTLLSILFLPSRIFLLFLNDCNTYLITTRIFHCLSLFFLELKRIIYCHLC